MQLRLFLFIALLAAGLPTVPARAAEAAAMLALADKPVRIIRGAQVFQGASGTLVLKDDIVETAAGIAQIELGADHIVALGPQTRLYLLAPGGDGKGQAELALLQGWVKVRNGSGSVTQVATGMLQIGVAQGAVIVHSEAGKEELFADAGEQQAARLDDKGKPGAPVKVPAESYAFVDPGKPLVLQARPAKTFLAAMPPPFRDRLAAGPALGKAARQPAIKDRDVAFADVEPWLGSGLAVRKTFVTRFRPRLKDPQFRKELDQALGQGSEWQAVLHPPATAARPRPHSPSQF
jgi:hypothetical protein